jgi:hypothetical protein
LDKKPFFLVRTKFDNHYQPEDFDKEAMLTELRASLDEHSKVFDCSKSEIHLISNLHPYQWDFLKLAKAITDALLPPQKLSFARIAKVQEVINLKKFQNFVQGIVCTQIYEYPPPHTHTIIVLPTPFTQTTFLVLCAFIPIYKIVF